MKKVRLYFKVNWLVIYLLCSFSGIYGAELTLQQIRERTQAYCELINIEDISNLIITRLENTYLVEFNTIPFVEGRVNAFEFELNGGLLASRGYDIEQGHVRRFKILMDNENKQSGSHVVNQITEADREKVEFWTRRRCDQVGLGEITATSIRKIGEFYFVTFFSVPARPSGGNLFEFTSSGDAVYASGIDVLTLHWQRVKQNQTK
jgi:hypothetical protein